MCGHLQQERCRWGVSVDTIKWNTGPGVHISDNSRRIRDGEDGHGTVSVGMGWWRRWNEITVEKGRGESIGAEVSWTLMVELEWYRTECAKITGRNEAKEVEAIMVHEIDNVGMQRENWEEEEWVACIATELPASFYEKNWATWKQAHIGCKF